MEDQLLQIVSYTIPSLVTGGVAYYFFNSYLKSLNAQRKMAILSERKKEALPIKLQAYERMLLFSERMNPVKMLVRIKPITTNTDDYLQLLLQSLEQEFEHNLVQQLYISDESWQVIITVKSAIIKKLKQVASESENAQEFREKTILLYTTEIPVTDTAISFLKKEIKNLL
jgi:hypothetical protein